MTFEERAAAAAKQFIGHCREDLWEKIGPQRREYHSIAFQEVIRAAFPDLYGEKPTHEIVPRALQGGVIPGGYDQRDSHLSTLKGEKPE